MFIAILSVKLKIIERITKIEVNKNINNPFYSIECYYFSRLSLVKDEPLIIEDFYLDKGIFEGIENYNLEKYPLSRIVEEKYFLKPVSGKQNFKIGYADKKKARELNISEDFPILIVERYLDFQNLMNAFYSEIYCKTDKYVFSQIIGGLNE